MLVFFLLYFSIMGACVLWFLATLYLTFGVANPHPVPIVIGFAMWLPLFLLFVYMVKNLFKWEKAAQVTLTPNANWYGPKPHLTQVTFKDKPAALDGTLGTRGLPLHEFLDQVEREVIMKALESTRFNKTAAAKLLGITFRSLRYRLDRLGID